MSAGDMESVVRPFQSTDVFTARYRPLAVLADGVAEPITKSWGKGIGNTYKKYEGSSLKVTAKWEEKSRQTEIVRVTNPTNSENYVDVERIKQLTVRNRDSGEEMDFKLNW